MAERQKVWDTMEYSIITYQNTEASEQEAILLDKPLFLMVSFYLFYIIGLLVIFIEWRSDAGQEPEFSAVEFYPVSLLKILFLSVLTFGLYPVYWFYRNWHYVKAIQGSSTMPAARSIFNVFWYYPLYTQLVKNSVAHYQMNQVLEPSLAVIFAVLYLLIQGFSIIDYFWLPTIIVAAILLYPLANYINHRAGVNHEALIYNSRWLFRHTLLAVLSLPLILFVYAGELGVLPSGKVMDGSRIWSHDLKYLHRNGVLPSGEKPLLFYSESLLSIRADGNGISEDQVFSYWKDEGGDLIIEKESFDQIKDVNVTYAKT